MTQRLRLSLCLFAGVLSAIYSGTLRWQNAEVPSDLTHLLWGAEAWRAGENLYETVGRVPAWPHPVFYPFPAILIVLPFSLTPRILTDALWNGLSVGWLTWELLAVGVTPRLVVLGSPGLMMSIQASQWSPILMAAALSRFGGFVPATKPTTALWWLAYKPWHLFGVAAFALLSLAIWPQWPAAWLPVLRESPHTVWLLQYPPAWGALLALCAWREPAARLIATLVAVPHTTLAYEALPVFLVATTWVEAGLLWFGMLIAIAGVNAIEPFPYGTAWATASGHWLVWCVYLPATVMVLRHHPRLQPLSGLLRRFVDGKRQQPEG